MSDPLPRVAELAREILQLAEGAQPEPAPLAPPADFRATYDASTRRVTCHWGSVDDFVEIHEFVTDPANTLKARVDGRSGERVSTPLAGGHPYTWAARCARGGDVSLFTDRLTTDVPPLGAVAPPPSPPASGGLLPADVLDLRHWTIMLPRLRPGSDKPENTYGGRWGELPGELFVRADRGVVFRAPANGGHSPGSKFPRTECREMADEQWTKAAWSSSEPHSLECEMAIDASGLVKRKRICGMQIHDAKSDVCQVQRHETKGLVFVHNDGDSLEVIDPDYVDGTRFTCKITATGGRLLVDYNGARKVDVAAAGEQWYWKYGCYLQSNVEHYGEPVGAFGEVVVWRAEAR